VNPQENPNPDSPIGEVGVIDMNNCALLVQIGYDGTSDIHAGKGISPQQAATWLRQLANHFEHRDGGQ
jgi:hypothetical protein